MFDSFVFLAPILLLAVVGLLAFVGCDVVFGIDYITPSNDIKFVKTLLAHAAPAPTNLVTQTLADGIVNGDLLVVWIWFHTTTGQTVSSVNDSAGNIYQPADALLAGEQHFATARQQVWFAKNVSAGTGGPLTLEVTFSGTAELGIGVGVFQYTGASKTDPLAAASQANGFGHDALTPVVPLAGAVVMFGAVLFGGNGIQDPVANLRLALNGNVAEDYFAPLPPQIRASATNPADQGWIAQLVAFR